MNQDLIIGKNIKLLRDKMNLSQEIFAGYLGVTREEVSYYENGRRTMPSRLISKAAELFCVDENDLFEQDPEKQAVNIALAFRADNISSNDLPLIANFQKIVRNYINMKKKLSHE
jgi:transcriptional regulator with XRE-family HTH domain